MRIKLVSIALLLVATAAVALFVMPGTDEHSATQAAASTEVRPDASQPQAQPCASAEERIAALEKKLADLEAKVGKAVPLVAVADLEALVNDCNMMKEIRAELIKKRDEGKARIDAMQAQLNDYLNSQKPLKEQSEAWWGWEKKIRPLKYELEIVTRALAEELMLEEMRGVEKVYEHVRAGIKKIAEAEGYTVVLWNPAPITKETWEQARNRGNLFQHRYMIDVRPMLYCGTAAVDITEDVLKALNKE